MDPISRLEASIEQARPVLGATTNGQYDLGTPCTDWDVRTLLNHMVGALVMYRDVADKGEADLAVLSRDQVGDEHITAFKVRSKEAVEALRGQDMEGTLTLPFAELPTGFAIQMVADDMLVHAWDLAQATGQTVEWDQELAAETLEWAQSAFGDPAIRGNEFGGPVEVADDADPMTRLVAYLGRQP